MAPPIWHDPEHNPGGSKRDENDDGLDGGAVKGIVYAVGIGSIFAGAYMLLRWAF